MCAHRGRGNARPRARFARRSGSGSLSLAVRRCVAPSGRRSDTTARTARLRVARRLRRRAPRRLRRPSSASDRAVAVARPLDPPSAAGADAHAGEVARAGNLGQCSERDDESGRVASRPGSPLLLSPLCVDTAPIPRASAPFGRCALTLARRLAAAEDRSGCNVLGIAALSSRRRYALRSPSALPIADAIACRCSAPSRLPPPSRVPAAPLPTLPPIFVTALPTSPPSSCPTLHRMAVSAPAATQSPWRLRSAALAGDDSPMNIAARFWPFGPQSGCLVTPDSPLVNGAHSYPEGALPVPHGARRSLPDDGNPCCALCYGQPYGITGGVCSVFAMYAPEHRGHCARNAGAMRPGTKKTRCYRLRAGRPMDQ